MSRQIEPRYLPAGECAVVVEYGTTVDPHLSELVLALDAAVLAAAIAGVAETVPTYRSLMVHFDPLVIAPDALVARLGSLASGLATTSRDLRRWTLPVCYAEPYSLDIAFVAKALSLTEERVVALHQGATYRVYMLGFAPGFTYLGGLPAELTISRMTSPRARVEENKLMIAGGQAIVTTVAMPAAWYVLAETAERLFSPRRDPVFLAAPGDEMRFEAVAPHEFESIRERVARGETVARCESVS